MICFTTAAPAAEAWPRPRRRKIPPLAALIFAAFAVPLIVSLFFKESWLWMDEVLSCLMIGDPSIRHMNHAIVSGMDANPPLFPNFYWILGHGISENLYFLRSVSVIIFAGTIALFYRYLCRLIPAPVGNFVLVMVIASFTYLNFTLSTQIRSYAPFFALGLAYFIASHRLLLTPRKPAALGTHFLAAVLLIAVHNFGLFYLAASAALFGALVMATRGRFSALPLLTHAAALAIWAVCWLPAFTVQIRSGEPHSWIALPTWGSFFSTVGELAPSLSSRLERVPAFAFLPILRFAVLAALFAYLTPLKLRRGIDRALRDPAFLFYLLSGALYFTTVFIALVVSFARTSVFLSRYLWPSQLLVMFQLIYGCHYFAGRRRPGPRWLPAACAAVLAGFVFVQNRKIVVFPRAIVKYLRELRPGYPVFVETADYLLPLWYHHTGLPVHYVLDWASASRPDNALSATVENRILTAVRENYPVPGIETLADFNAKKFPRFYLVDEAAILEFERFLSSGRIQVLDQVPVDIPGQRILDCRFAPSGPETGTARSASSPPRAILGHPN